MAPALCARPEKSQSPAANFGKSALPNLARGAIMESISKQVMSMNPIRRLLVVVALAGLAGCAATAPDIRTDYDRGADFSRYRSFGFVPEPTESRAGYETIAGKYIRAAVAQQMEQRGYVQSDNPDLLVNYSMKLEAKQSVTPYTTLRPYYGYRSNRYRTWVGYQWETDTITSDYTEGTLNIDIVDRQQKQLVWEGVAVGTVSREEQENREAAVTTAVGQIFARYPFAAGRGQPQLVN